MAHPQESTRSDPVTRGLPQEFRLSSPAFADGAPIPKRYTSDDENVSPRLTWQAPPAKTESFALVCEDPDAPKGLFVHWLLWNVPADRRELEEGVLPRGELADHSRQGLNGFGDVGYGGPRPPRGAAPHRYAFRLYALDTRLDLKAGAGRTEFNRALEAHVLGEATLTCTYQRS